MRKFKILGALAGAALVAGTVAATPASAASGSDVSLRSVKRGSVTCFNYSWNPAGIATYTVYYHNTCKGRHGFYVTTNSGLSHECISVAGGAKGHKAFVTKPIKFAYKKSC
ncbi:hypothetical protein ACIBK8_34090 [Streptomyces sp. NPDC050161]|uniref:hypothetical protein n=1 Tax=unclassified Streptomyces TaxID=2593676 RepID=UPI0037122F5A